MLAFAAAGSRGVTHNGMTVTQLQRSLGPTMIWGLGVGLVISGMYFGWNLGLPAGGPYGLLVATGVVTILYTAFVLGYAELACACTRRVRSASTSASSAAWRR